MSDSWGEPWSNNPNAPQISFHIHMIEKGTFAGKFLGAILNGIIIALFFQCMNALLHPVTRTSGGIKWWLVAHTAAMFTFLALPVVISLHTLFVSFIDNREYPGNDDFFPGPLGYEIVVSYSAMYTVFVTMFPLNQWLGDGFLLYRCFVIYSMNYRAIAFPLLIYLASIAMGIADIYQWSAPGNAYATVLDFDISYYSISFSLNILLTLMIVTRLLIHSRNLRNAVGVSNSPLGSYTTIITIIVESYALYAAALLLYIVPWALGNWIASITSSVLGEIQVIAPYLITLRVANRRALTSESVGHRTGGIGSMQFRGQGTTDDDGFLPGENPTNSIEQSDEAQEEPGTGGENAIEAPP